MRSKATKFVRCWFVTAHTKQDNAHKSPKRVLCSLHPEAILPQADELIHDDAHKPLDLVGILLLRARQDTSKHQIAELISKIDG
jgi:hypothetical protein